MSDHRVLICDDHWIVRQAIRQRISELPGFEVVDEVAQGKEVKPAVREHRPDLVILDIEMPDVNGIQSMERILSRRPRFSSSPLTTTPIWSALQPGKAPMASW